MKKKLLTILTIFCGLLGTSQLYIQPNALIHISNGGNLEVGGNLENDGAIQNLGSLSLYGNWLVNNNFNGLEGSINLFGNMSKVILPSKLSVSEMTVNLRGTVSFPGEEYVIRDRIDFQFGKIQIEENTRFILGENARVVGGSNDSYFEGTIISRGSGIKTFPIGINGIYAPLTLLRVFGANVEIAATFLGENPIVPEPGDDLLGVSHRSLWELELKKGDVDETKIQVEFNKENLADFIINNPIRHRAKSLVITSTDILTSKWSSLGVTYILDTDSLTYGTIVAEVPITPTNEKIYFSVGLAPRIPDEGLYFIPEIFSPNASDPINRSFKVFGEHIVEEDFYFRIFNRIGLVMYETRSFEEANKNGWNGINRSGGEEPNGVYFYEVKLKFVNEEMVEENGFFYLIK